MRHHHSLSAADLVGGQSAAEQAEMPVSDVKTAWIDFTPLAAGSERDQKDTLFVLDAHMGTMYTSGLP
jgi:hypothetical protein